MREVYKKRNQRRAGCGRKDEGGERKDRGEREKKGRGERTEVRREVRGGRRAPDEEKKERTRIGV